MLRWLQRHQLTFLWRTTMDGTSQHLHMCKLQYQDLASGLLLMFRAIEVRTVLDVILLAGTMKRC